MARTDIKTGPRPVFYAICLSAGASVCRCFSAGAWSVAASLALIRLAPIRLRIRGLWASSYAGAMPKRQGDA